jgi:hypothetical protein
MPCRLSEYCQFYSQTEQELLLIAYLKAGQQLSRCGPEQHTGAFLSAGHLLSTLFKDSDVKRKVVVCLLSDL